VNSLVVKAIWDNRALIEHLLNNNFAEHKYEAVMICVFKLLVSY